MKYLKSIKLFSILIFSLSHIISCDLSNNKIDNDAELDLTTLTLTTNPSDPLIAIYTSADNEVVHYYGLRNQDGIPTEINLLTFQKEDETISIHFDSYGRPNLIYTEEGSQFMFDWIDAERAVFTAISGDGEIQINSVIDFRDKQNLNINHNLERIGRPLLLENSVAVKSSDLEYFPKNFNYENKSLIKVTDCGVPLNNAKPWVQVYGTTSNKNLGKFPTKKIGEGLYSSSIPSNVTILLDGTKIYNSSKNAIDKLCNASALVNFLEKRIICHEISIILAATKAGIPVAVAFSALCNSAAFGLEVSCSSAVPGSPTNIDTFLKANLVDRSITEDVSMYAYLEGPFFSAPNTKINTRSAEIIVSAGEKFPNFEIEMGSETKIEGLILKPSSPSEGQDYVAELGVFCLKYGSTVTMSVLGTDGYSDSVSNTVPLNSDGLSTYRLTVPGAEQGVQDVISTEVWVPGSQTLRRIASLRFQ